MTRLLVLLGFLCAGSIPAMAQATFTPITINSKSQPGLMLELPNNTAVAEGTILQKLKETGYSPETTGAMFWKKNKQDGFYVFNGVSLLALSNQKLDLYFKVERKSRRQKNISNMYLLISKGYDNFVSPDVDSVTFNAATDFLNGFLAGNVSYILQQEIEAQEKVVAGSEKKLAGLEDENKSLLKKIEQLQAEVIRKTADRSAQANEIARQKSILETLKAKSIQ